jgi:hypothetical protein
MSAELRMRYELDDYDAWRQLFDRDPLDRRGSGVRSYRISRDVDNDAAVLVDLEFGTVDEATAFRARLKDLLSDPATPAMARAETIVTETTESVDL